MAKYVFLLELGNLRMNKFAVQLLIDRYEMNQLFSYFFLTQYCIIKQTKIYYWIRTVWVQNNRLKIRYKIK